MQKCLYQVKKTCPVCGTAFATMKVRQRLTPKQRHSDFFTEYEEINPYLYEVWVCPHCGYAAPDEYFAAVDESQKTVLCKLLAGKRVQVDFSGERTLQDGINAFKIAIFLAEHITCPASRLAGMYLRLAWLLRLARDTAERECLGQARKYFEQAYFQETLPLGGKMSGAAVKYMIGELCRRTGEAKAALKWFSEVVYDRSGHSDGIIATMAREQWQKLRRPSQEAQG